MKITIAKDVLTHSLSIVSKGISPNPTSFIYSGILIDASQEGVTFQAANNDTSIKNIEQALVDEPGRTVIPGKLLNEIVKSLPNEAIVIETLEQSNKVRLNSSGAVFEINSLNPQDFQEFPKVVQEASVTLPAKDLSAMVKSVAYALSTDTARPTLTGIYLKIEEGTLVLVATDSYRVAKIERKVPQISNDFSVIVPGVAFKDVISSASNDDDVTIGYNENQIIFVFGSTTFITRKIEGNFINYQRVFPTECNTSSVMSSTLLNDAVKRVRVIVNASPTRNVNIKFSLDPELNYIEVSASFADVGGAVERIPAQTEGEKLDISFNPNFVLDGLSSVSTEEVAMEFTAASRPGIFRSVEESDASSFIYLVMPVRSS